MRVGGLFVLYDADFELFNDVLMSIYDQVDEICIVDNSSLDNTLKILFLPMVKYIPLYENKGIALAQNVGIKYFQKRNIDSILFMDQDSTFPKNAINKLVDSLTFLLELDVNVAAIGPSSFNRLTKKMYSFQEKKKDTVLPVSNEIKECYAIMSSGSLVPIDNFAIVGFMNESLFIDAVDYEWCWRAWNKCGMRSFVDLSVAIEHQLGSPGKFLWRDISVSSPMRLYYQFRNCIWLSKVSYTPTFWKLKVLRKYICKFLVYPIFFRPKISYLKSAIRGIIDGLFGHMS